MSFTTQDMLDWALIQKGLSPGAKIGLIALAMKADESGDGKVKLGCLAKSIHCELLEALGYVAKLAGRRLIVFTYRDGHGETAADDEIVYGLCIDMGGA